MNKITLEPGMTKDEIVQFVKQEYEDGKVGLIIDLDMDLSQDEKNQFKKELSPYMMEEFGFGTLVIWKKPIGIEFRTSINNVKASSSEELKQKVLDNTPGVVDDVNSTFLSTRDQAVITLPYKDAYRPAIGLFIQPWIMEKIEQEEGTSGRQRISPTSDRIESFLNKILKDPDQYELNEMTAGSLLHKTREAGRKDGSNRVDRPW